MTHTEKQEKQMRRNIWYKRFARIVPLLKSPYDISEVWAEFEGARAFHYNWISEAAWESAMLAKEDFINGNT